MNHEQPTLNRTGSLPNKQFHVNSLNDIDPHQSIDDLEREIEYTRLSNQGIRRHQSLTYGHKNYPIKLEHYDQPSRRNNKKLNLITDFNDLSIPAQPASASAYVPPIGHSSGMHQHPTHIHQPPPPPLSATAALWNNQDRQSVVGMAPSSQWRCVHSHTLAFSAYMPLDSILSLVNLSLLHHHLPRNPYTRDYASNINLSTPLSLLLLQPLTFTR